MNHRKLQLGSLKKIILGVILFLIGIQVSANEINLSNTVFIDKQLAQSEVLTEGLSHFDTNAYHLFSHGCSGELLINGKWLNAKEIATFLNSKF